MKKAIRLTILTALMLAHVCVGVVHAEIIPPYGPGQQIGYPAVVLCESLTLREKPSSSSKALHTLKYGDLPIVINADLPTGAKEENGFVYCTLDDSEDSPCGWINSDYLLVNPAWYVTEEKTPVFAWSDTAAPKVALLDAKATLPILKDEGAWLIVSLRGVTGWIHRQNASNDTAESPVTGRQDGERFETVILLEGMEETVRYEHVVSPAVGVELDYDYETLERRAESDRECFISRYDDPEDPRNTLEVRYSPEDADAVFASASEALSADYEIITEPCTLERAGSCLRIDASCAKGGHETPDLLQTVHIIPAGDGCIVATVRTTAESAEGFGARFRAILNTLAVIDRRVE